MTADEMRLVGRLEAQSDHMRAEIASLRDGMAKLDAKIDGLTAMLEQAKGASWAARTVWALGGVLIAAAAWLGVGVKIGTTGQ